MPHRKLGLMIPTPKKIEIFEEALTVPASVMSEHPDFELFADTLRASLAKLFDTETPTVGGGIVLRYDQTLAPNAYRLDSTADVIVLSASAEEGMAYALATALQAIASLKEGVITIAKTVIEDAPEKDYRALMVDLAREWHAPYTLFHYVDVCFMLKIRYFHIHFMDDQRYTFPSRVFPEICTGNRHYTFEDIEALRLYAKARGVVLIPEFEVPGHARTIIKRYPEIFANKLENAKDATLVTEDGTVITAKNVICAGNPKTMDAIRALIEELCEMFPDSPYIHIGGDEANIKAWNYCTECKRYMEEHGISSVKELYSEFTGRVAQIVLDCGKTPIVWEGFPKEGVSYIPKETIVMAWESYYHMVDDLLAAGFRVINNGWQPLYVVNNYDETCWNYKDILAWNVYNWQHWWRNSTAYLNPIHVPPTDQVIGAQISSWQCTYEQEIGKIMENLAALSERTWNLVRYYDDPTFDRHLTFVLQRVSRMIAEV